MSAKIVKNEDEDDCSIDLEDPSEDQLISNGVFHQMIEKLNLINTYEDYFETKIEVLNEIINHLKGIIPFLLQKKDEVLMSKKALIDLIDAMILPLRDILTADSYLLYLGKQYSSIVAGILDFLSSEDKEDFLELVSDLWTSCINTAFHEPYWHFGILCSWPVAIISSFKNSELHETQEYLSQVYHFRKRLSRIILKCGDLETQYALTNLIIIWIDECSDESQKINFFQDIFKKFSNKYKKILFRANNDVDSRAQEFLSCLNKKLSSIEIPEAVHMLEVSYFFINNTEIEQYQGIRMWLTFSPVSKNIHLLTCLQNSEHLAAQSENPVSNLELVRITIHKSKILSIQFGKQDEMTGIWLNILLDGTFKELVEDNSIFDCPVSMYDHNLMKFFVPFIEELDVMSAVNSIGAMVSPIPSKKSNIEHSWMLKLLRAKNSKSFEAVKEETIEKNLDIYDPLIYTEDTIELRK